MTNRPTMFVRALCVIAAMVFAPAAVHAADPAAVLVQLSGSVKVQRAGQSPALASVGMSLLPGDKLLVPQGAKAVLLYRTGKLETATAPVTIADTKAAQAAGLFSRTVQTLTVVATTDARQHPNRQGMIRPIAGSAVPIAPRNDLKVMSARPTFVWFRIPEAPGYMVQIRRVDGPCTAPVSERPAECKPVRFDAGADTVFKLPMGATLPQGGTYEWAVAPTSGGRVSEPQRFRTASGTEITQVTHELQEIARAGLNPAVDGLFLAALAYRNADLFYEAKHAIERMEPELATGKAFHQLKAEILNAVGDVDGASREFATADSIQES